MFSPGSFSVTLSGSWSLSIYRIDRSVPSSLRDNRKEVAVRSLVPIAATMFLFTAAVLPCHATGVEDLPTESWYSNTMFGVKAGYSHEMITLDTLDDMEVVYTNNLSVLSVKRLGIELGMSTRQEYWETVNGKPLRFVFTNKLAGKETITTGVVKGDSLHFTASSYGREKTEVLPWDDDIFFPWGLVQEFSQLEMEVGDSVQFKTFVPEANDIGRVAETYLGLDTLEVAGERMVLRKYVATIDLLRGVETEEWRDDDGELIRSEVSSLKLVSILSDSATALATEESAEVMIASFVETNTEIEDPYETEEALYAIVLTDEDQSKATVEYGRKLFPTDDRQAVQKVVQRGDENQIILKVQSVMPTEEERITLPIEDESVEEYLADTIYLQVDDPLIVATAREAIGDETDAWKAAVKLEKWVHENITAKGLGVAFATAKEVCESREGDCTEHGVLLAALARVVGIPSRVAAGLVYFEGKFGYHMWSEVYVGKWIALDATLGAGRVDATHIKLADSGMERGWITAVGAPLARAFARMRIDVIEYTVGGRRTVVQE